MSETPDVELSVEAETPPENTVETQRELSPRERERLENLVAYQESRRGQGTLRRLLAGATSDLGTTAVFFAESVHRDL